MKINDLKGRIALITGGSEGIGWATAKQLAESGVEVKITDINNPKEPLDQKHFYPLDLKQANTADELFAQLNKENTLPDIIICNAGRGIMEKLSEGDPKKWDDIIQLNLMSHLRVIRAFVPAMLENKKGDIVFISSVSAHHVHTYGGVYAASKAALEVIGETLRLEVQPHLRVTVVSPGVVDTNFFKNTVGGNQTVEQIGWGSLHPDDIADTILFALRRPEHVSLNQITIRPSAQPM